MSVIASPSWADWADSQYAEVIRPLPANLEVQAQNPPAFSWAKFISRTPPTSYKLEITKGGVVYQTITTPWNVYLPSKQFPAGTYTWRVLPNTGTEWSTPRSFVISAASKVFEVPENDALRAAVLAKPHPRMLPADFKPVKSWSPELVNARGTALALLKKDTLAQATTFVLANDASWPVTSTTPSAARQLYINDITRVIGQNVRQLEASALLFRLTGEAVYLNEALRRGDALAALNPSGMTSYVNHDIATRSIMVSLAKGADILNGDLDATRKANWMASVKARVTPMYTDLISNNYRLDERPFDSHSTVAVGYVAAIASLTLGDIPEAQTWFDFSIRRYINSVMVWSGPEGGFGNGTAYGMFAADYAMQLWQPIGAATGVDIYKKPWSTGFANYFAQFLPPGAPGNTFGDAHEEYLYLPQLKAYMSRIATPAAAWYVQNVKTSESPITLLQAPFPLPVDTVAIAAPPPNAAVFPSIGWVAMHSNLADRARTSVFFKSSPYGSYNHSHGDQNSLVIDSGGRRLLTEAGYQDYYYSPLGVSWYRQTKSHNAITYGGGIGQVTTEGSNNLKYKGKITAFSTTAAVDYAEGDATLAYSQPITSAIRKVWYLRNQDVVVVLDKMASSTAQTFEWNMHAVAPYTQETASSVKVTNVDRSLCIRSLSTDGTRWERRTGPANPGKVEDHGVFIKPAAATSAEFLVVLDVNCKRAPVSISNTSSGRVLKVGTTSITLPK
ncbi:DUF4962 domain-containing protein [Pseudoduganella lutea]|uniref:DUF4962 domain-containing protein n=2 Tax=Pseudoduganella lutea TaxID=321985 RepID=A0A4V0Z4I9_9BURK|nr:DUF4962 domain-containing protein [Pseudoduganella lutea]